jgi:pyruvate/2-oxoacid:ferredoxin oxidoreductase beta subunit
MPSAIGRQRRNRDLTYIGISGDGDSLSIGLGQFCHAIRRNVRMLYLIENNGVYGLTKGQFSASADVGTISKRKEPNRMAPIEPVQLGLTLGATFIARSFSGDKAQLIPISRQGCPTTASRHNLASVLQRLAEGSDLEGVHARSTRWRSQRRISFRRAGSRRR